MESDMQSIRELTVAETEMVSGAGLFGWVWKQVKKIWEWAKEEGIWIGWGDPGDVPDGSSMDHY